MTTSEEILNMVHAFDDEGRKSRVRELAKEVEKMERVLKLTPEECLAGGFVHGLPYRDGIDLDEHDKKMLETAGKCISRILNQREASHE